jgi:DNA-directed RNA polymerase sigma subunit (sigma70/sigma32)
MADDLSLIQKIKKDQDEDCLKELISRHSGIYLQIVNQTISDQSNVCKSDIIDEKDLFIYEKALKYDPNRNIKFSTYLGNEIRWKCLNIHNRAKKYEYCDVGSQEEHLVDKDYFSESSEKEVVDLIFEKAEKSEDHRVRKSIQMRYKDGFRNKLTPWEKIANKLKLSIQGCINIHNRFIKEIKKEVNYDQ